VSPPTPGGSAVRFVWKNLAPGTTYEWFYTVIGSDGISKKVGPRATFSTPP
jgi:hypothetical protein